VSLEIIPGDIYTLTDGERMLLKKFKKIYEDTTTQCFLYVQPRIKSLEPDFILIDPNKGVAIFEVKDWSIGYIRKINKKNVETMDGKKLENPILKANIYYNLVNGILSEIQSLIDNNGKFILNLKSFGVLINISQEELLRNGIEGMFPEYPSKLITSKEIRKLDIDYIFGKEQNRIEDADTIAIRASIFPEIKIVAASNNLKEFKESIANYEKEVMALDARQEKTARKIPYGHYMVTGVPGCGKTVILLARAIHLIKENPDWNIQILTYNKSLKAKLEIRLDQLADDLKFSEIKIENISISTFHSLALKIANVKVPKEGQNGFFEEELPELALEKAKEIYDAILIDEYQDFRDSWVRLCIKLCKKHNYETSMKEEKEVINMFLAGDRLQSIYNPEEQNWASLGLDMRGRSTLLKDSYRIGGKHIRLALEFLLNDNKLREEVEKFYEGSKGIDGNNDERNSSIEFIDGSYNTVASKIELLISTVSKYSDILILYKDRKSKDGLLNSLSWNLRSKCNFDNNFNEEKINIVTYHSSKGLEAPICILVDADKFEVSDITKNRIKDKKLLYVGMTRASSTLIIHGNNHQKKNYLEEIKEIAESI
jgi:hypothetical protein